MFKLPKKWVKELEKEREEKERLDRLSRLSPPRLPESCEDQPLHQANYTDYFIAYETNETVSPSRMKEQVMQKPMPKLKPKKVSAEEPPTIRFSNFANLDEVPCIYGA
mgnify:FL=1